MPPRISMWQAFPRALRLTANASACMLLAGCSAANYYWQAAAGHAQLLIKAKPVGDWLGDPSTPSALRERLVRAQQMREFASNTLHLPRNASYTRYADLGRPALLWNVVAAPPLSLKPYTWCFPVAGCVAYKGYFDKELALQEVQALELQGLEVKLYPVPAYSTLGWSNWVGGDPLLNTFVGGTDASLARLIFHELAHQQVYAPNDSAFNEAFASAVEQLGGDLWLQRQASAQEREREALRQSRQQGFKELTGRARQQLQETYQRLVEGKIDARQALAQKRAAMAEMRERYAVLKSQWQGYTGYDRWIEEANNASFVSQATYERWVPAFIHLFEQHNGQWALFYDAVSRLAQMPLKERQLALEKLMP